MKVANAKSESRLSAGRLPRKGRARLVRDKYGWRKILIYPGGYVEPIERRP